MADDDTNLNAGGNSDQSLAAAPAPTPEPAPVAQTYEQPAPAVQAAAPEQPAQPDFAALDASSLSDIPAATGIDPSIITPEFQEKMARAAETAKEAGLEVSPINQHTSAPAAEAEPTMGAADASGAGLLGPAAAIATIDSANAQPAGATATTAAAAPVEGAPIAPPVSTEDAAIVSPAFQETSGPISTDPEWAGVSHILYRDPLEIEAVDQAAEDAQTAKIKKKHLALQEFVPLDAATLAFLAVRYGGLERDPAFLERIQAKAGAKGVTIEQYLASQETDEQVRADVLKDFKETHPLLNQQGNPLPFVAVRLETRPLGAGHGLPVMALVDNKGNIYRDSGNKTTVELKLGEKFSGNHARNMARTYIARRRNPTTDGEPQEVRFNLSTGRGLLRSGLGMRDKDKYEQSLMLLAVLQEAELGGVKPVIGTKGMPDPIAKISADGKDPSAGFGVHPRALEEMRLQCPEIDSLIEKYNNGWPKKAQEYSLEGEEPKADAPAPEAQAEAEDTPAIEDPRVEQHPEPVATASPVTADAPVATPDVHVAAPAAEVAQEAAVKPANPSDILAGSATAADKIVVPTIKPFTRADAIGAMPQAGVPKVGAKADDWAKIIPAEQPEAEAHASSLPAAAARPQTPRAPGLR